ncbi:MAG: hypothetical protein U5L11_00150 [Arhodomonas sp.]|nr:hypothetical protein [Arhodomonas sp.]
MDELRWLLIVIGALVILGIYLHGTIQNWRHDGLPWSKRRRDQREPFAGDELHEPHLDDELPEIDDPLWRDGDPGIDPDYREEPQAVSSTRDAPEGASQDPGVTASADEEPEREGRRSTTPLIPPGPVPGWRACAPVPRTGPCRNAIPPHLTSSRRPGNNRTTGPRYPSPAMRRSRLAETGKRLPLAAWGAGRAFPSRALPGGGQGDGSLR